jgi:hypothetical protein
VKKVFECYKDLLLSHLKCLLAEKRNKVTEKKSSLYLSNRKALLVLCVMQANASERPRDEVKLFCVGARDGRKNIVLKCCSFFQSYKSFFYERVS